MRICKYCGSLIEGEPVMNPDEYGNGYHHFCIIDKEFRERDKSIFQKGYDKGKADVLDEIWAEIPKLVCCENEYRQALVKVADVIKCIDKHRKDRRNDKEATAADASL